MAIDFKKLVRKIPPIYRAASALYVYLKRHSQLCQVPIDICTNPMAFSFAPTGWNYLIEQLKEFDSEKRHNVQNSALWKFHEQYQPKDMSDLPIAAGLDVAFKPGLSIYPWGSFDVEKSKHGGTAKNAYRTRFHGPSSFELVERDFFNLLALYEYMKVHGYRPWYFANAFIGGVFLERENGQKKFVVLQGNHRTAILAHLGYKQIWTRYLKRCYKCISEKDVSDWFYVKSGECSVEDAKAYFDSFFVLTGKERAKRGGFGCHITVPEE